MSKQFYYKRIVTLPPIKEGAESETRIFFDSFNTDYIIRTVHQADGSCIVLLDDGHEESVNKEIKNDRGKVIETKRERDYYFSQITLQEEDRKRLQRAVEIYVPSYEANGAQPGLIGVDSIVGIKAPEPEAAQPETTEREKVNSNTALKSTGEDIIIQGDRENG